MFRIKWNRFKRLPTPHSKVLLQLFKKFASFYRTRRARYWSLSWARWIHSTPSHPTSISSVPSTPSGLFPSGFPETIFYAFLISPMRAVCPFHLILRDLITLIVFSEACKFWSSSLCSLLQSSATSSSSHEGRIRITLGANMKLLKITNMKGSPKELDCSCPCDSPQSFVLTTLIQTAESV